TRPVQYVRATRPPPPAPARSSPEPTRPEGARRIVNVAIAAVGLVAAVPVMLVISALIKLTSGGPVFYKQLRVGIDRRSRGDGERTNHRRHVDHGGRPFTIYKFCSMDPARSRPDTQVWAAPDDPRVTSVGRLLRQYRLDELP